MRALRPGTRTDRTGPLGVALGLAIGFLLLLGVALVIEPTSSGESRLTAPVTRLIDEATADDTRAWLVPLMVVGLIAYVVFMIGAGIIVSLRRRRLRPLAETLVEKS